MRRSLLLIAGVVSLIVAACTAPTMPTAVGTHARALRADVSIDTTRTPPDTLHKPGVTLGGSS
jgi:hypothetical protein